MSRDIEDIFEEHRGPKIDETDAYEFATTRPGGQKRYEEVAKDLESAHAYGEVAAKENAKEALEQLYSNEFPIDDPPESFERYEAEMAVRALRNSVADLAHQHGDTTVVVADIDDGDDIGDAVVSEWPDEDSLYEEQITQHRIEIAKSSIDVMKTYGKVAEPHIAALARRGLPSEVREYAVETLAEIRGEQEQESVSLREALGRWLLP
jgi:hypothetical protein